MLISPLLKRQSTTTDESDIYRKLFDNMLDGFAYCRMIYHNKIPVDFEYLKVNKNFEKLTSLKNVEGKKVSEVIPNFRKTNKNLLELYGRVASTGKSEKTEVYIDQLKLWFLISSFSLEKGTFVAAFQNITDDKLRADQSYLQIQALKVAAHGIVIADTHGIIEWVNPAFTKITGYSAEEAVGKSTNLLKSNKQDPAFYKNLWETITAGKEWNGKLINKKKSGELYIEDQTITPVKDSDGKIIRYIAIKQDITEKQKLLEESERAKDIIDFSEDVIFSEDLNGNILTWNKKAEEVYGYSKKEILGKSSNLLVPNDRLEEFKANLKKVYQGGKVEDFETQRKTKGGKILDVSITISPIIENGGSVSTYPSKNLGEIIGYSAIYRDITELKKAKVILEEKNIKLEKSEEKLMKALKELETAKNTIEIEKLKDEAMLNSIGLGIFAVDQARNFMLINPKAEEILGMNSSELITRKMTSADIPLEDQDGVLIPPEKRPTYLALKTKKIITNPHCIIVRPNGTKTPISITVTPIIDNAGNLIGAIDAFRDITEELEIDRAKSDFVSIASHQLRTPLGISKWYLEAIYNEHYLDKSPDILREYLDVVYKNNLRLLELVKGLLSVSRIDQERVKDSPNNIDVVELIKSIIKGLEILADNNKITISFEEKSVIPRINIDSIRLREVIENLVVNGIKYNVTNGKLNISIAKSDKEILLEFKDTGIGISANDQKNLFLKFFRSEGASLKNPEGSGLGLYVAKAYINSWGGNIRVESTLGKGSTFYVTLPLKPNKIKNGKEVL